jgi:hypothetical protein
LAPFTHRARGPTPGAVCRGAGPNPHPWAAPRATARIDRGRRVRRWGDAGRGQLPSTCCPRRPRGGRAGRRGGGRRGAEFPSSSKCNTATLERRWPSSCPRQRPTSSRRLSSAIASMGRAGVSAGDRTAAPMDKA